MSIQHILALKTQILYRTNSSNDQLANLAADLFIVYKVLYLHYLVNKFCVNSSLDNVNTPWTCVLFASFHLHRKLFHWLREYVIVCNYCSFLHVFLCFK